MEKMVSIKSESLKLAREYYAVTLEEVCIKTKIKIENLKNYESGEDYPSYSQLEKLAAYYNRPLFFFFSNYSSADNKAQIAFRSIQQSGDELTKHTRELIEKADAYRLNLDELYQVEDEKNARFIDLITENACFDSSDLIDLLRKKLELGLEKQISFTQANDLLEYLREKLYDIGIYVFKDSFKDNSIAGLCVYDEDYPIILLNNKTTFTRQIFTLFHEIYHIFLKEADIDYAEKNEETECNKFASNFLIPENDLLLQLSQIDDIEDIVILKKIAQRYKVSVDAIMYRLVKMGYISKGFYRENSVGAFRQGKSAGGNFYYTKMSYLGNAYLNKVFTSYYAGKISKAQVGIYTSLKTANVSKLASKMFGGAC